MRSPIKRGLRSTKSFDDAQRNIILRQGSKKPSSKSGSDDMDYYSTTNTTSSRPNNISKRSKSSDHAAVTPNNKKPNTISKINRSKSSDDAINNFGLSPQKQLQLPDKLDLLFSKQSTKQQQKNNNNNNTSKKHHHKAQRRMSADSIFSVESKSSMAKDNPNNKYNNSNNNNSNNNASISINNSSTSSLSFTRRSMLSKSESQRRLNNSSTFSLAKVDSTRNLMGSFRSNSGISDESKSQFDEIKEACANSNKNLLTKRRVPIRRSASLSSIQSNTSTNSQQQELLGGLTKSTLVTDQSSTDIDNNHLSYERMMHMSTETMPVTNVVQSNQEKVKRKKDIRTEQMVESLVWFSFHIPRTVLEDLIAHELNLWKKKLESKTKKQRNKNKSKSNHTTTEGDGSSKSILSMSNNTDQNNDNNSEDGSVSSLSDEGNGASVDVFGASYSEKLMRREQGKKKANLIILPKAYPRESAILFVDMSGFTKLSTMLDVESLSKVINSYFDMIVSEVILHGGDILKFAGDAFFAEWKVMEENDDDDDDDNNKNNPLSDLNASLVSINEMAWDDHDIPPLSHCVMMAAKCATSIVKKFSDYHVTTATSGSTNTEAMLNLHCGVGVGQLVGLHVGDYKVGQAEEDEIELRREFLILGEPIDQVAKAADVAKDGEVMASPEAMLSLAFCCDLTDGQRMSEEPVCIASRDESFLSFDADMTGGPDLSNALQPYESLRMHCKSLGQTALQRMNLQMALYVHPVIRADELALSAAIQAGKISQPTDTLESRHRAEAELRSVYTMFITPIISPRVTGLKEVDQSLYEKLGDIMHVTSRELDRYSGHLRQFIVDDKGVVLIATFGLRGSTFPNMVENNCLPSTFAIHRALKSELNVENRIGATFGKVYCGVVGGVRRHEFACMGAPVNLAARLMSSKVNNGILVDEAVHDQCRGGKYKFKSLPPVKAKGYDKPVPILEPEEVSSSGSKKRKALVEFTGRKVEKRAIMSVANGILDEPGDSSSSMIFLTGESGYGKTALGVKVLDELKAKGVDSGPKIITAKSSSTETEQRIPLSSYRKIFLSIIRDRCEHDGDDAQSVAGSITSASTRGGFSLQSMKPAHALSRRSRLMATRNSVISRMEGGDNPSYKAPSRAMKARHSVHVSATAALNNSVHGALGRTARSRASVSEAVTQSIKKYAAFAALDVSTHSIKEEPTRISPTKSQSMRFFKPKTPRSASRYNKGLDMDDSSRNSVDSNMRISTVPYFEKLCWACEHLDYPYEYADIVGSQFLGFESATPITHVDGHIPTMDELVEFLALAFICIADFADLAVLFLDDFQWVDAFSWRIFRVICKRAGTVLLICATRSHDKQALRRITSAATPDGHFQSQMIEISLGPLDFNDIRELMSIILVHKKSVIPDSLCTDIFQMTGGMPVYVIQFLENIRRKKMLRLAGGELEWTEEGIKQKKTLSSNKNGAVMEETFLSRFDALDVRVRKVLQTCAVLGLSFSLEDVIRVHPEMDEGDIENALDSAIEEMILLEQVEDEAEETMTVKSGSSNEDFESIVRPAHSAASTRSLGGDRYFQFSNAMWRKNVLSTMLKERKMELHRLIAESMERDQVLILEESDISRLLTLFDHWKACGDFCKVAPLALAVGARLEEWDLSSQSLELYEDALEMVFDGVEAVDENAQTSEDWVKVKARPIVLDLILRLHICIGLCHQRLGEEYQSILYFEDAYNIINTSSKLSTSSKSLKMPIISSLCVLKIEADSEGAEEMLDIDSLIDSFLEQARGEGVQIHIGRALALKASYLSKLGEFEEAVDVATELEQIYDVEIYTLDMVSEYGRDFAIECLAECSQWLYLLGRHDQAEKKADQVVEHFLKLLDPVDVDYMMQAVFPIIQVYSLLDRAKEADVLLKKHIINPYHDYASPSEFWAPLFNPLAYLLQIIVMEEDNDNECDEDIIQDLEEWVLDCQNAEYEDELRHKAYTIMGEICWRLVQFKDDDDPSRKILIEKAREFLIPVARFDHDEIFLKRAAEALLEGL